MDVTPRPGLQETLKRHPQVEHDCEQAALAVVDDAQDRAPKDTGFGASTIHHEPVGDEPSTFRVGWSPDAFYLRFHELGSEHQPARPFLRPAADAPSHRIK